MRLSGALGWNGLWRVMKISRFDGACGAKAALPQRLGQPEGRIPKLSSPGHRMMGCGQRLEAGQGETRAAGSGLWKGACCRQPQ